MCDGIAMMGLLCFGSARVRLAGGLDTEDVIQFGGCMKYLYVICCMTWAGDATRANTHRMPDVERVMNGIVTALRHDMIFFPPILTANKLILLAISKNWTEGCITESNKTNLKGFTTNSRPPLYINLVCPSVNLLITSGKLY